MCSWYDTGEGAEGGSAGAEGNSYEGTRWERFHASLSEKGYFRVCCQEITFYGLVSLTILNPSPMIFTCNSSQFDVLTFSG